DDAPADLPVGVVPYPPRDPRPLGDVDDLVEARPARVAEWIAALVEREGPLHVDEALRALAAAFGTRATARPREAFERGLAGLVATGRCARRGAFLWPQDLATPRVRWRGGACPVVEPDLVAPEEWDAAVRATLAAEFGAPRDGLVAATVRRLGFQRGGPRLKASVEAAVDRLLARGEVATDPHGDLVLRRP
ncbi:MAG: DUF3320 domain-containing protein, partial [Planctomycetia bacterium]|nr:DUF3320 domain-containing protein [Planctomycetia bacterium]